MRRLATKDSHGWTNAVGLAAATACIACADAAEPASGPDVSEDTAFRDDTRQQPIADGQPFVEEPGVLAVVNTEAGGARTGLCTGTLILPNLVLTARHCVAPSPEGPVVCGEAGFGPATDPSNVGVSPDARLDAQSQWFGVERIYVPPGADDVCGGDIVLLLLPGSFQPTLVPPLAPRLDMPVVEGEPYLAAGYGTTGEDGPTAGLRRARGDLRIQCPGSLCAGPVADTEFAGETGACEGDSGGPALDQDGLVLGTLSRGGENCTAPIYGSVSEWSSWIADVAQIAAEEGGYSEPAWVSGQEPSNGAEPEPPEPSEAFPAPDPEELEPVETPEVEGEARLQSGDGDRCSIPRATGSQSGSSAVGWALGLLAVVLATRKRNLLRLATDRSPVRRD